MTTYLFEVTFGLAIKANTLEDAEQKARAFERAVWTISLDDTEAFEST